MYLNKLWLQNVHKDTLVKTVWPAVTVKANVIGLMEPVMMESARLDIKELTVRHVC